ncbi:hypothetical protein [Actinacidiphila sp. bgisy144]|uniref:hypothetical protein n=1 Tax=Actinacidiphila sp. bgisy144 TaxID=3413791 RepID=UPI003EBEC4DA
MTLFDSLGFSETTQFVIAECGIGVCLTLDAVGLYRNLPHRWHSDGTVDVPTDTAVYRAALRMVIYALTAVFFVHLHAQNRPPHWTDASVRQRADTVASAFDTEPVLAEAPIDKIPDESAFEDAVNEEFGYPYNSYGFSYSKDGLTIDAEAHRPPPGAVDSYVITGMVEKSYDDLRATDHQACLVILSARLAPAAAQRQSPDPKKEPMYTVRTKVTSGACR